MTPTKGLYALTPDWPAERHRHLDEVAAVLEGGAVMLQYRAKQGRASLAEASRLLGLCQSAGVPLIINDEIELARQVGAAGVHLGGSDGSIESARAVLGSEAIIGVSCYNSLERARQAEEAGASYVAFGRFYGSRTKPNAPLAELETLKAARRLIGIPVVAIGGITSENAIPLLSHGAGLLAVVEGVFGAADPRQAAATLSALCRDFRHPS